MAGIFGALGLNDTEYVWQATQGQGLILDAVQNHLMMVNAEIERATQIFVAGETENHKERYKLPGGGRLQKLGQDPQGTADAIKANGGWDVAYPLEEHGAQIANTRVSMAYMTVGDLDRHISTVIEQNVNTVRYEMLLKLFTNTTTTFVDTNWGSLTVQPLANADGTNYPPVVGSESEADDTHHLESGYTAANISDTNNPYVTIEAELVEHFGKSQGNDNVAVFIHGDQKAKTEDLTDFVEFTDRFVMPGDATATLTGLPSGYPGRVIGRTNGCWVIQWDWIPTGYMVGIHLDTDAPLKKRVDPAAVGLGRGLQLVAEDETHPFESSHWSHRFGFGVGNRLSAVVMEIASGGSYTIPTAYQ